MSKISGIHWWSGNVAPVDMGRSSVIDYFPIGPVVNYVLPTAYIFPVFR